jgi:uncharacterized protein
MLRSVTIQQIAALPYRHLSDDPAQPMQILLVTSRDTGRWIIPKGNLMPGIADHAAAAVEAQEEAGLTGTISAQAIGSYPYAKALADGTSIAMTVAVYPLRVTHEAATWKEQQQRTRQWFSVADAVARVDEPELKALIAGFGG